MSPDGRCCHGSSLGVAGYMVSGPVDPLPEEMFDADPNDPMEFDVSWCNSGAGSRPARGCPEVAEGGKEICMGGGRCKLLRAFASVGSIGGKGAVSVGPR